jgi:hypothetical protein
VYETRNQHKDFPATSENRMFIFDFFGDDWYQDRPQFVVYRTVNPYGITATTITNTYGPPVAIEHTAGYHVALLAPAM